MAGNTARPNTACLPADSKPTLAIVLSKMARCMATELRGAALGASYAPRTVRDWSKIQSDADVADFCTPAQLPSNSATLVYAEHGINNSNCSEYASPNKPDANVAKITVAVGQVPYTVCAAGLLRLVAVLLTTTGAVRDASAVTDAIVAVRAHQQAKRDGTTSRRCGLYFVDFRADASHIVDALLQLHQRVLLADDRAFLSNSAAELRNWVAARDSFLEFQLTRRPDLRQGAHSRFSKGLGPMTLERGTQPRSMPPSPMGGNQLTQNNTNGRRSMPPSPVGGNQQTQPNLNGRPRSTPPSPAGGNTQTQTLSPGSNPHANTTTGRRPNGGFTMAPPACPSDLPYTTRTPPPADQRRSPPPKTSSPPKRVALMPEHSLANRGLCQTTMPSPTPDCPGPMEMPAAAATTNDSVAASYLFQHQLPLATAAGMLFAPFAGGAEPTPLAHPYYGQHNAFGHHNIFGIAGDVW